MNPILIDPIIQGVFLKRNPMFGNTCLGINSDI